MLSESHLAPLSIIACAVHLVILVAVPYTSSEQDSIRARFNQEIAVAAESAHTSSTASSHGTVRNVFMSAFDVLPARLIFI